MDEFNELFEEIGNKLFPTFIMPPKPCCGNCHYCDFFTYEDENGESQCDWNCTLKHSCFDFDDGFCDDYE